MLKKKVMFVISQLGAGGSERVVLDLAKSLDPVFYEVYVAAFKGGVLEIPLKSICKKVFIIDKTKGVDGSLMIKLAEIVRTYGIDVVNAHHFMPFFTALLEQKY